VTYLVLVLAFAIPLISLEWLIGWRVLLLEWRPIAAAILMSTIYLGLADMAALHNGIWSVAESKRLGIDHGSFILEEWLFILATNTIIVQTVTLALDADLRERANAFRRRLRR
jgi:lycopene cyclase domain-containing protein